MNYKDTLNLPKTDFPMKADLVQKEPQIGEFWKSGDIHSLIRKKSKGKPKYILHDGPPYANGDIHIGHALNKILKDIIMKYKTMQSFDSPYIPGWDCHGLPVEHQLFKELGITKYQIDQVSFRKKAHDYAMKFVNTQREQFVRLGVFGFWDKPYLTLDPIYESKIIRTFGKLVKKGYVYKGVKPVNWCATCETALAEAEVEYNEKTSHSIFVKFILDKKSAGKINPEAKKALDKAGDAYVLIWTTTPWTLVSNVAIAVHPELDYVVLNSQNKALVLARELLEQATQAMNLKDYKIEATLKGKDLEGLVCRHPFIERESKVILGDFVSNVEGTGCVHIAPGHGALDYEAGLKNKLPVIMPVNSKGRFDESAGELAGVNIEEASLRIMAKLQESGLLPYKGEVVHSYPHCWRCKKPIVFRATEQWFMSVDKDGLREKTLNTIKKIKWIPYIGEHRISGMIQTRPDWCLSRQRYWGVPIPAFYCKKCKKSILNEEAIETLAKKIEKEGSDAWFKTDAKELLPKGFKCPNCQASEFEKENDILDVWFDSGVSGIAVCESNPDMSFPADLYLEGSDQHRGWFQSSLLATMGAMDMAPFKSVLTHGFVVDGEGRKMSKSLGNVISPLDMMKTHGADIIRLWVASCDYNDDIRISREIIERVVEGYRKIRNTYKFILGNIYDYNHEKDKLEHRDLLEIDKWAVSAAQELLEDVTKSYENYEFHKAYHLVYNFCTIELSSFYLDILKDRLYTYLPYSRQRRSAQTALYEILMAILKAMAPVMSFTTEEAWKYIPNFRGEKSVHLADWPQGRPEWIDKQLNARWEKLVGIRPVVLKAIEEKRMAKEIGNSLEAEVLIKTKDADLYKFLQEYKNDLSYIFIVSKVELKNEAPQTKELFGAEVKKASGEKCQRCWTYSVTVGKDKEHATLCGRCAEVVKSL